MRKKPPPPPREVLRAILERRPEFRVVGDRVYPERPVERDHDSLVAWVAREILASPYRILHRSVLTDAARRLGYSAVSVGVYLLMNELFVPLGRGCFGVIGHPVEPLLVELAWEEGQEIAVSSSVDATISAGQVALAVVVGSSSFDNGSVTISKQIQRLVSDARYRVVAEGSPAGEAWIGVSKQLQGFRRSWEVLELAPGDEVAVMFDLEKQAIYVRRADFDEFVDGDAAGEL